MRGQSTCCTESCHQSWFSFEYFLQGIDYLSFTLNEWLEILISQKLFNLFLSFFMNSIHSIEVLISHKRHFNTILVRISTFSKCQFSQIIHFFFYFWYSFLINSLITDLLSSHRLKHFLQLYPQLLNVVRHNACL